MELFGTLVCFLRRRHRWGSLGVCETCRQLCRHSIWVYNPADRTHKCMDCGYTR